MRKFRARPHAKDHTACERERSSGAEVCVLVPDRTAEEDIEVTMELPVYAIRNIAR